MGKKYDTSSPKQNVARSNRAGITIFGKFPRFESKMLQTASCSKDGGIFFFCELFSLESC